MTPNLDAFPDTLLVCLWTTLVSFLGGPGVAFGCLVGTDGILWRELVVLVRLFGCRWLPWAVPVAQL